mmetsp:Transcript_4117/g.7916  ORF Transcript_4117/g.7916 Transcript_4117/m.7916 type:complete len:118 (-) Transcript_4117:1229-1582(-)
MFSWFCLTGFIERRAPLALKHNIYIMTLLPLQTGRRWTTRVVRAESYGTSAIPRGSVISIRTRTISSGSDASHLRITRVAIGTDTPTGEQSNLERSYDRIHRESAYMEQRLRIREVE